MVTTFISMTVLFFVMLILGHQLQVCQVREADVLRQKAYMLFYVRDSVGNSVLCNDNITANGTVKKTPEKISSVNGITESEKKIHNISNSSILVKTSMGCSKHDVKTEGAAASQNNGLPAMQKTPGPQNDSAALPTKSIRFAATEQGSSSSFQPSLLLNSSGKQLVTDRSSQKVPPKADKVISIASPVVSGVAKLAVSDEQTTQPQAILFSKPTAHGNGIGTGFNAPISSNKVRFYGVHCIFSVIF
jgi:ubiquitin carboxyl-terminal hydrolase 36/42